MASHSRKLVPDPTSVLAVLAGVVGLLVVFRQTLATGLRHTPGTLGDVRLVHYLLEHEARCLAGKARLATLFDAPFFYPERNVVAYSHVLLPAMPPYGLLRAVGVPPDLAYTAWLACVFAGTYLLFYAFARRALGLPSLAAAAGGYLAAFGSPRGCQMIHPQVLLYPMVLLVIWALHAALRGPSRRPFALAPLALAAVFWTDFYPGFFLLFGLLLALLVATASRDLRGPLVRALAEGRSWIAAGGLAGALFVAPLALHELRAARLVGYRPFDAGLVATSASWLFQGNGSLLYGWLAGLAPFRSLPFPWEHGIGIGPVTAALVLAGLLLSRHDPFVRLVLPVTAMLVLVTTSTPLWGAPWRLVHAWVPGAGALRAVVRVGVILLVVWGVGLARAVARAESFAASSRRPELARGLLAVVLLVVGLEQVQETPHFDRVAQRRRIDELAAAIPASCPAFLFTPGPDFRPDDPYFRLQLDAMWASLASGVPTVNGYSGMLPRGWPFDDPRAFSAPEALDAPLRAWFEAAGRPPVPVCRITTRGRREVVGVPAPGPAPRRP